MDRISPIRRSWLMSRIRSRDTKPELVVRKELHRLGYRFRLHAQDLPGKPDLAFPRRRKVVFVHGCYWHGHSCRLGAAQSKSNLPYWRSKLERNRQRDSTVAADLRNTGWKVLVIWECQIKRGSWQHQALRFLGRSRSSEHTTSA